MPYSICEFSSVKAQYCLVVDPLALVFFAESLVLGLLLLQLHSQVGDLFRERLKLLDRLVSFRFTLLLQVLELNLKTSQLLFQLLQGMRQ